MATFNKESLQKDISAQLGGETVKLEIGSDGWEGVFHRTLEVYSRYKPLIRHVSFKTPVTGMYTYEFDGEVTGVDNVEISPGIAPGLSSGLAIESAMLSGQPVYMGVGDTFIDIQYYDLRRRWIKAVSRELGSDPDYEVIRDPDTNKILLYTFGTQELYIHCRATINHNDDFSTIPDYSRNWIAEWCLAEAMITIGNARSKVDHIPVAGDKMRLNGNELIERANKKKAELINQIQSMRADLFPRWA